MNTFTIDSFNTLSNINFNTKRRPIVSSTLETRRKFLQLSSYPEKGSNPQMNKINKIPIYFHAKYENRKGQINELKVKIC